MAAQELLLLSKLRDCAAEVEAMGAGGGAEGLLGLGGDALAAALDMEEGHDVTDPGIYRAHAARYEAEFMQDMEVLGCRLPTVLTRVR